MWLMMIFSILRALMLGMLTLQQSNLDDLAILQLLEKVIDLILRLYMMICSAGIAIFMVTFLCTGVIFMRLCISESRSKDQTQHKNSDEDNKS